MRRTCICLGVILALALLYSIPTFAQHGPSGDSGMLSAGEMRAVIKAGGTFDSPNKSGSGGGMRATFSNGVTASADEIKAVVSPSFSNTQAGAALRSAAGTSSVNSQFGLDRGHSAAMGSAVNAIQVAAFGKPSVPISAPVVTGGSGDASSFSGPQPYAEYNKNGKGDRAEAWRNAGFPKPNAATVIAASGSIDKGTSASAGGHWEPAYMAGTDAGNDLGIDPDAKTWVPDKSTNTGLSSSGLLKISGGSSLTQTTPKTATTTSQSFITGKVGSLDLSKPLNFN
jgi:hypothetical protein